MADVNSKGEIVDGNRRYDLVRVYQDQVEVQADIQGLEPVVAEKDTNAYYTHYNDGRRAIVIDSRALGNIPMLGYFRNGLVSVRETAVRPTSDQKAARDQATRRLSVSLTGCVNEDCTMSPENVGRGTTLSVDIPYAAHVQGQDILQGDLNGDGKTDLYVPTTDGAAYLYLSK